MRNLRDFFNSVSGNNRIFTSEDIGTMSPEEFSSNEQAIRNQWGEIGIPSDIELSGSDDVVYVRAYTRGDGTEVRAHYRSKGGGRIGIGTVTGGASGMGNSVMDPNQGAVRDERNGYYDPKTGKKVYYPNEMYMTDSSVNIPYEFVPAEDLGAVEVQVGENVENSSPVLQGSVEYNDNISIYESLLKGNLPELRDWNENYRKLSTTSLKDMMNKGVLDANINIWGMGSKVGKPFWNMASFGLDKNIDYIDKNGSLYEKISDLPLEFQDWAKDKVNSQFEIDDCRGVVFDENSKVSKKIANSQEFKEYISKNLSDLMAGKVIKNSIGFKPLKDTDLWSGLGRTDVLKAKVKDGNLEVIIGDTYDFNKNSNNILVKMGRQAQDAGILEPYYSIIKVKYKL